MDRGSAQRGLSAAAAHPWIRPAKGAALSAVSSLLALLLLTRPYFGIRHDSMFYVGRAEGDLGIAGMAQDLRFLHDHQSGFSIFEFFLRPAAAAFGSEPTAMLLTLAGLLAWTAAAAALLSRWFSGARLWAAMAAVLALPATYGGFQVLSFAEPFLTPRLFGEAAALFALALVADRRPISAAAALSVAAAFHPIMAASAAGVWLVLLVLEDRRWLLVAGVLTVALVGGAAAGIPLLDRLFRPVDPAWLQVLKLRATYLFPALWPSQAWATALRQFATLLIAASLVEMRLRRVIVAVVLVGAAGLLVSVLVPSLLILQSQPWRTQWLAAVFSAGLLPLCIAELWRKDGWARVAAAALSIAWGAADFPLLGGLCAVAALALTALQKRTRDKPRLPWICAWSIAGVLLTRTVLVQAGAAAVEASQAGAAAPVVRALFGNALTFPAAALATWTIAIPNQAQRLAARPFSVAASLILLLASALAWNAQSEWALARETHRNAVPLRAQLPPGEILWLGALGRSGPWTGRPDWWSDAQGSGAVFDRSLAIEWARRYSILVKAGVIVPHAEFEYSEARPGATFTPAALATICGVRAGPAAIIAERERIPSSARGLAIGAWSPGVKPELGSPPADFLIFDCRVIRGAEPTRP